MLKTSLLVGLTLLAAAAPARAEWISPAVEVTYVDSAKPAANFGGARLLRLRAGTEIYLRFEPSPPPTARVTLCVDSLTAAQPFEVWSTSPRWTRRTLTWTNRPAAGVLLASAAPSGKPGRTCVSWRAKTTPTSLILRQRATPETRLQGIEDEELSPYLVVD
jgi:hypothetical protein